MAVLVGGCQGEHDPGLLPGGPAYSSYVALGDSYTAGPFVPSTDLAGGCLRSDHNYPHLLADRLEVDNLVDVSCSGADTGDLRNQQRTIGGGLVPAQLRALSADTDLVTVGIGGNDLDLFVNLALTMAPERSRSVTRRIGNRVTQTLRLVQRRAPDATVVLVGYLRLVDRGSSCPDRLPFTVSQVRRGYVVQVQLAEALRRAAETTGSAYADMFAASGGHGVCSAEPWVQGQQTDRERAAAYHPLPAGMQAVARRLAALLRG